MFQHDIFWLVVIETVYEDSFYFSSKTSVLVWCALKQDENEPKTTVVSEQLLQHILA
jgi:hypothetical protein